MNPAINVLADELSDMILAEVKSYLFCRERERFEAEKFKQNIQSAIHIFFSDYGLTVVRASSLRELEARIRRAYDKKPTKASATG